MKKVININFQGRVIPIEETAFDLLKQYIESLRTYFAREEGRDEIINDIESRIAELFSERLKKGVVCITDQDVNEVSASIGRPEDFEDDGSGTQETAGEETKQSQHQQQSNQSGSSAQYATGRGRLYRNTDDKILGGVCSGLGSYLGIDPVFLRILFVLLFAPLFWVYIILWIVVPGKSVQTNITKRLYRSSDDKVIAGVAGGLASYFHIDAWIPRLIFGLPVFLAVLSGPLDFFWDHWNFWGPKIITGSLGWTLFITYVILWIAVPVAVTASEKLEMKGERVDINSIADTVKEDLKGFQQKAEKWGQEVKQSAQEMGAKAQQFGKEAGDQFKSYSGDANSRVRNSGFGHAIGVIFKVFFMVIFGCIAAALFVALIWVLFGFNLFPMKAFLLDGFRQETLAWLSIILLLGVPVVAILTWLIRSIVGAKKNKFIAIGFSTLWTIGLICAILLAAVLGKNFRNRAGVNQDGVNIPVTNGRLDVDIKPDSRYYSNDWFGMETDADWPFYAVNSDTMLVSMVRVEVVKSKDSLYHARLEKYSRGRTTETARRLARKIKFNLSTENNTLYLPEGFEISRFDKWRAQQVLLIIEVPVGKKVFLNQHLDRYESFDLSPNRRRRFGQDFDRDWYWTELGKEYVMTENDGPRKVEDMDQTELRKGNFKLRIKDGDTEINAEINTNDSARPKSYDPRNDYRYDRKTERKEQPEKPEQTEKKERPERRDSAKKVVI